MASNLNGKVAIVTGGGRDVGRQIALALAADGAAVALNYNRSSAEAEAVVGEIRAAGGNARAYRADVGKYEQVKDMVDGVVRDFGRIDILVNNAGLVINERFVNTTPEQWAAQIDVDLYGTIHTCHAVAPHMIKQNFGRIITLAGDSSRIGENGLAIAAAARAGGIALMKSLAKELGRANVTANAISLGLIETAHSDPEFLAANREKIVRQYPLRRIGKPEDVAPTVAFLASEGAAWITGQVLSVNGGFCMV
ncbi:SDR family NAD(P)-dependent oxidoreductase [Noviherbaspirillum denitrificans]|uniref:3-oxoacyl-ACP reductase n=1 Tax=Noviherbaspirillum denitrificans TaxID=1968433 RepID=A0A254TCL2_9BURK|nr:SDR family oxidoreductase [Noviherbaspirillum denitrificans]OWW20371.1 3-oxoacyl-ACP reductase [Noviherbaspirillum denitrificans]